jgi:hypothetical protein
MLTGHQVEDLVVASTCIDIQVLEELVTYYCKVKTHATSPENESLYKVQGHVMVLDLLVAHIDY